MVEAVYKKTKGRPYQFRFDSHILNLETNEPERYEFQDRYVNEWEKKYKANTD